MCRFKLPYGEEMPEPIEEPTETVQVRGKHPLGADLIIPVASAAFAAYYLYTIWGMSWHAAAAGIGISSAMAIILLILTIRFVGMVRRGEADLGFGELVFPASYAVRRAAVLVAAVAFIYAMPFVGFTIALFSFLMLGIIILSGLQHLKAGLIIALSVSVAGYLLFIVLIGTRFPRGPFEKLFGMLF
jgi:hypothetical protein